MIVIGRRGRARRACGVRLGGIIILAPAKTCESDYRQIQEHSIHVAPPEDFPTFIVRSVGILVNQEKSDYEQGNTVVLKLRDAGLLNGLDEGCQQRRSLRQFRNKNGLMRSVRAFADAAQSVKRGNAEGSGEVSV